jgi:hypothetical protein
MDLECRMPDVVEIHDSDALFGGSKNRKGVDILAVRGESTDGRAHLYFHHELLARNLMAWPLRFRSLCAGGGFAKGE